MRHELWRAVCHRLVRDVIHAIHAVDEGDGAAAGNPKKATACSNARLENLGGVAAREREYGRAEWLILAGNV